MTTKGEFDKALTDDEIAGLLATCEALPPGPWRDSMPGFVMHRLPLALRALQEARRERDEARAQVLKEAADACATFGLTAAVRVIRALKKKKAP
jgi:hypothetical protein